MPSQGQEKQQQKTGGSNKRSSITREI